MFSGPLCVTQALLKGSLEVLLPSPRWPGRVIPCLLDKDAEGFPHERGSRGCWEEHLVCSQFLSPCIYNDSGVFKEGNRWPGTSGFWKVCCVTVNTLNPQAGLAWLSPPRADGPPRWASEPFARFGLQASAPPLTSWWHSDRGSARCQPGFKTSPWHHAHTLGRVTCGGNMAA